MQNDQTEKVTLFLEEFQVSNEFVRATERRETHARAHGTRDDKIPHPVKKYLTMQMKLWSSSAPPRVWQREQH